MYVLNTHLDTARVKWFPDKTLVLQIENREQTQLELLQVSPDRCVCLCARVGGVVRVLIVSLHACCMYEVDHSACSCSASGLWLVRRLVHIT